MVVVGAAVVAGAAVVGTTVVVGAAVVVAATVVVVGVAVVAGALLVVGAAVVAGAVLVGGLDSGVVGAVVTGVSGRAAVRFVSSDCWTSRGTATASPITKTSAAARAGLRLVFVSGVGSSGSSST